MFGYYSKLSQMTGPNGRAIDAEQSVRVEAQCKARRHDRMVLPVLTDG